VQTITAQNAYVFTEYILPRIRMHVIAPKKNPSTALRATYASCLASLATTALRFLEMMQALRLGGTALAGDAEHSGGQLSFTALSQLYDNNRADLLSYFEDHTTGLLEDTETSVRRAFLGSIATLCFAFGSAKASDVVLSHLNTYLNDRDWQLKCAFFETIVGVATYVGSAPLEEYMLPLMVQSLTDPEETVVERVLRSFSAIAELGLFQKSTLWELVDIVARFTMHPNTCIREAAAFFISSAVKFLSAADVHSIIIQHIRSYLKTVPPDLTEVLILDALKKPLPRVVFDYAILWAQRTEKGSFWKAAQIQHTFTFGGGQHVLPTTSGRDLGPRALNRIPQNEEDHAWLARLRQAGMAADDEFKLVALREFIIRVAHRRASEYALNDMNDYGGVTKLSDIQITPQLVFFDKEEDILRQHAAAPLELELRRKTIAEALQDARDDRLSAKPGHIAMPKPMYDADGDSGATTPVAGIEIPVPKGLRSPTGGPQIASSADSRPSIRSEHKHHLKSKGSSISLMGGGKAKAEIGTTNETALGRVDTSSTANRDNLSRRSMQLTVPLQADHRRSSSHPRIRPTHNYRGNDPTVLRLLDAMYLEKYPQDLIDFGPLVARRQSKPIKRVNGPANTPWRPEGTLVAMLSEHTEGVNRITVAPDHTFFVTGSDDGTVKVWDSQRLEKNVTNKSRQTHKQGDGVKITALAFVEDTHCFISAGSDGSIHVVRVEYMLREDGANNTTARYGRLRIVRQYFLPQGEHATWLEQFRSDHKSVLLLCTNRSRILALELRSMEILYALQNPVRHGVPLCFCVDKKRHWLVVGTSHGVLDLWDLRFKMRIKAWSFAGGAAVNRLSLVPTARPKSKQLRVAVVGGTGQPEVTVWDLERVNCTGVYRTGAGGREATNAAYKLAEVDEEKSSSSMLSRFATTAKAEAGASSSGGAGHSMRALATGMNTWEGSDAPRPFFLTAGPDWKVRFWDTSRADNSTIVSGLEVEEGKPSYTVSQPSPDLQIVTERLSIGEGSGGGESGASTPTRKKARSGVISMQTQKLLRTHLDTVTDVSFLECPYGMVVSADRAGVVYVFS
jgi:phosphoinositide-3-kinase regulatory subunit 4